MFANDKRRLFRILAHAEAQTLAAMSAQLQSAHEVAVVSGPGKTLAMVKLRETVAAGLFYLGEVIVWEAVVTLDGTRGMAVTLDNAQDRALNMAVIDAAVNHGVFAQADRLLRMEAEQNEREMRENALHGQTRVQFASMDAGT